MKKSGWLLNRLQTGCFAILILCGLTYLVALWQAPPKAMPFQLFGDDVNPSNGYLIVGKLNKPYPPLSALFTSQHPFASRSAFAYTMVVFACLGLMTVAAIAVGRILAGRDRKADGVIGWTVVMVGAWSLVLLVAAPFFVPCPTDPGPGITCSIASQSASRWALSMLPLALLLTVLPAIVAFSTRRLMTKPAAPSAAKQDELV